MNRKAFSQKVIWTLLMTLPFIGCKSSPTKTPTSNTPVWATSADEIVGTWHSGSEYYLRFDTDGTFRQAESLDKLGSQPYAVSSYHFEGTKVVIVEISVSGVPSCGETIGSYKIRLFESGNIHIFTTEDQCTARAQDIDREYQPVP